jgi:multidrug resistance efflux pump
VGFDLVGRLSEVLVEEGARVTLGQELARLETDQARPTCAPRRPASVRRALRCIGSPRRRSARGRCWPRPSARRRGRAALFERGAIAGQQRDEARDRLRVARAELDRVLAQRSEATRGIDVAAGGAEQRGWPWCAPRCWRPSMGW